MKKRAKMIGACLFVLVLLFTVYLSYAEPEGATIINTSVTSKNATTATSRQDPKGTITTLQISTVQQDIKWKAYVGNVSGTLVLRDAEDFAIYQWPSGGSPSGEVYMTLNTSIDWDSIQCANTSDVQALQTAMGHGTGSSDNINNTFGVKTHKTFDAGKSTIAQSSCWTAYTYVNNTAQTPAIDALYQEVLLMDKDFRVVFTTLIDQDANSYRYDQNGTLGANITYDFQALVPDFAGATIATYYFYVEIDG
ncbi:MAG: hypothetical protein ABIJ34_03030 [archaeon]